MKRIKHILISAVLLFVVGLAFPSMVHAQTANTVHANVDWQFNLPLENGFADKFSGWGLNIDGAYYITDNIGLGLFVSYHTNQEYIPRQTLAVSETSSLTTDQKHSLFQLPFGVLARYAFIPGSKFRPYIGFKMGPSYVKTSSYMNIFKVYDESWGFYLSPEVGAYIYVDPQNRFAIHLASYYSYSTNKNSVLVYPVDGLSNWGLRLGLAF